MVFSNIFQDMMHFVYAAFVVVEFFLIMQTWEQTLSFLRL